MYSKWQAESENCMLVVNACVMHGIAFKACRLNIVNSVFAKVSLIKTKSSTWTKQNNAKYGTPTSLNNPSVNNT